MGMIACELVFKDKAPDINEIVEQIEAISGLQVSVTDEGSGEWVHDTHVSICFEVDPDNKLEFTTYSKKGVEKEAQKELEDLNEHGVSEEFYYDSIIKTCQGRNEKPGEQTVYLVSYMGLEQSLKKAVILALHSMKGELKPPFDKRNVEELREQFPITEAVMKNRIKKSKRRNWLFFGTQICLLPLTLVFLLFSIVKMKF